MLVGDVKKGEKEICFASDVRDVSLDVRLTLTNLYKP